MNREIDKLGRIVIPKEMRKELSIDTGDEINITLSKNKIILTKNKPEAIEELKDKIDKQLYYLNGILDRDCVEDQKMIDYTWFRKKIEELEEK